jgi:ADP-ribose pyrophosphatase YjhB (NUDIX family)
VNTAVIDEEGRVLLTRREDFHVWCLPGGHVDEGESLAEAAIREAREEVGLDVRLTRLVGIYSRPNLGGFHSLAVFAAVATGGMLQPHPEEVAEVGWFGPTEIPRDVLWGEREWIEDVFSGRTGVVRSTHTHRPDIWPRSRSEHYEMRDRSGLSRVEFYDQLREALGDERSRLEVEGA